MGNKLTRKLLKKHESKTRENSTDSSNKRAEQTERQVKPRRDSHCRNKKFVESPFDVAIRERKFSHIIFQENVVDKMIQEGLINLNLDEEHDGETFNIPPFLRKYANDLHGMKIKLNFVSSSVSDNKLSENPESAYLVKNMKYLKLWYLGHPLKKGVPIVIIKESHGNYRRNFFRKFQLRDMFTRIKIIRGKCYAIFIGKDFMLTLTPPERNALPRDFDDSNGQRPLAIGFYTRMLDTNPQIVLEWQALLFDWYNEIPGAPYFVEELLEFNYPKLTRYIG